MKAEKKLKLSIEALDNFGVRPEIIKDMLNDLDQVLLDKKSEKIAKEHFRKQRDNGLIELQHYTKDTTTMHYTQQRIEFTKEFIGEKIERCERTIKKYKDVNPQARVRWSGEKVGYVVADAKKELEYWKDFYSHFV